MLWTDGLYVPGGDEPPDYRYEQTVADLAAVLGQLYPGLDWKVEARAQEDGSSMVGATYLHAKRRWGFACHIEPCGPGCTIDHDQQPEFRATVVRAVARRLAVDIVRMN